MRVLGCFVCIEIVLTGCCWLWQLWGLRISSKLVVLERHEAREWRGKVVEGFEESEKPTFR